MSDPVRNAIVASLPTTTAERKAIPIVRGVLDYFPAALAEVAKLSQAGNDKHNPGQELHWSRGKSGDHADCIVRHLVDRGTVDPEDGIRHSAKIAWRALALLQEELEAAGLAPLSRGSRGDEPQPVPPFKCNRCDSTRVFGDDLADHDVAELIRAKTWGAVPCDNMECYGHMEFAK